MRKNVWIVCLCAVFTLTGCSTAQAAAMPAQAEQTTAESETAEPEEVIEDLDEERFKRVRYRIQEELLVFDASRLDDGLMSAARDDLQISMAKAHAETAVKGIIETHADLWKREIITENMEYLIGAYTRADFEKMVRTTSNDQIQGMIAAYVLEKLEQEGYQFYE